MNYNVTIEKMVFGGDCIAKIDGKTIFIPFAIPGEEVEIELTFETQDYGRGKITKIIKPSEHRTEPFCKYYGKCGGCNMQHISADYQKELRKQILKDAFVREGLEVPEIEIISGSPDSYRSRFQFHNGGMMEKHSNQIISLDECPCATTEINKYLKEIPFQERPEGRVHVFGSSHISGIPEGFDKIIIAQEEEHLQKKQKNIPQYTPGGRKTKKQKQIKARYEGTSSSSRNLCYVQILDKTLVFDVQGFFQSNLEVLEKTIPFITENISGTNVLDMYSGCGTFSVFLKDKFKHVTLVEHNKSAIVYAEQNMAGFPHESFGLSGEVWTKYHAENCIKARGNFDAVVIDPPRSGMEKSVCQWLCSSEIPVIKSISCDIATHARDAKFLIRSGYKLNKLFLLDFYPQTGHIESLTEFVK